jgi:tetratricopeptide (TPR) repeat protein
VRPEPGRERGTGRRRFVDDNERRDRTAQRGRARPRNGTPGPNRARPTRGTRHTEKGRARDREEFWLLEVLEDSADRNRVKSRRRGPTPHRLAGKEAGKEEVGLPQEVREEITRAVGSEQAREARELSNRMERAASAYARDRYSEAFRITRSLVQLAPSVAAVRELHGLVCYRLGRWKEAARHLEAARELGRGDVSQIPVIMDCRRAMGQHRRVEALFEELRASSPPADVLTEGRLVLAGQRADRGDIDGAIDLLVSSGAGRNLRHPRERHLRQWYVLADLYERAGDLPRARELFGRVAEVDPALADAPRRLAELGRSTRTAGATRRGASATSRRSRRP